MKGLIYKDIRTILSKFKLINRISILIIVFLVVIFLRESGVIFLSIFLPIAISSIPSSLLVYDSESGWNKYVALFPISKKNIIISRYISCLGLTFIISICCAILNLASFLIFREYSLDIHLTISLVGMTVAIIYMVFLLPAIYTYGVVGSNIINIVILAFVMLFIYVLQQTLFGDFLINVLSVNSKVILTFALIIFAIILILGSLLLSIHIYASSFKE